VVDYMSDIVKVREAGINSILVLMSMSVGTCILGLSALYLKYYEVIAGVLWIFLVFNLAAFLMVVHDWRCRG
jgi:hypothetical protein